MPPASVPPASVAPEGSLVALGETVASGKATLTALRVIEDSRCPANVQCVWQGRVVVEVAASLRGKTTVTSVVLGEGTLVGAPPVYDYAFTLDEVTPAKTAEAAIAPADYRFRFGR